MIINGANLGKVEVNYNRLSNYSWSENKDIKKLILYLENLYYEISKKEKDFEISQFPIDNNGKVLIEPGMLNHSCSGDIEILKNISKYGILASEWFGVLESEREGCFCTFLSRMKNDDYKYKGSLAEDNYSRLNIGKNVLLFLDAKNPIMQYLLHLDYFEYENIKKNNNESIRNKYSDEEIELFDKLIEPISPAGTDMRKDYDFKFNYWSAIPGGIPSFLINGICIKKIEYSEDQLDELNELFPNATIFKNNLDIVRYPKNMTYQKK